MPFNSDVVIDYGYVPVGGSCSSGICDIRQRNKPVGHEPPVAQSDCLPLNYHSRRTLD